MDDMNKGGIYCIRNIINNKSYIGSAIKFKSRKNQHFSELRRNIHTNGRLQNAFNKYGEENFVFEILCIVENKYNLIHIEDLYIKLFDTSNRNIGYNICSKAGSLLGFKFSDESKKKMSIASKGKRKSENMRKNLKESYNYRDHPMLGKNHSVESKKKMSISKQGMNKGVPKSEETKIKISNSLKGFKHSEESKRRMSEKRKGIKLSEEQKIKRQGQNNPNSKLTIDDVIEIKKLINKGQNLKDISIQFEVSPSCISNIKRGKIWSNINIQDLLVV